MPTPTQGERWVAELTKAWQLALMGLTHTPPAMQGPIYQILRRHADNAIKEVTAWLAANTP